jgi:hypothetical protein
MSTFDDLLKPKSGRPTAQAPISVQSPPSPPQVPSSATGHQPVSPPTIGSSPPLSAKPKQANFGAVLGGATVPTQRPVSSAPASGGVREQCQPVLRADTVNLWGKIETAIETVYRAMLDACASLGIDAYVGRNNAFEFPFAARFECWIPPSAADPHLTERSSAYIRIDPQPWHRYEMEYTIEIDRCGRKEVLGKFGELAAQDIHALLQYLVRHGPKPHFSARIKQSGESFWSFNSVENKPIATRKDYLNLAGSVLSLFGIIGLISSYFVNSPEMSSNPWFAPSLLATVLGIALVVYVAHQPRAVRSTGRPEHQPRSLRVYDSWQAVLFGAAPSADLMRQRFLVVLKGAPMDDFQATTERIGYRVLDEPIVREQIVLKARRGIVYCQIYEFGSDLYVGWQSFLNRGRWLEKVVPGAQGIDRTTGRRVEIRTATPGWESLCEYDFFDASCLTEWTHAQLVALTKQLMKELQIDQEIDFKIVRGERRGLEQEQKTEVPNTSQGLFKRKS